MQYVYVSPRVFSLLKSEGQNFQNISYSNKGHNKIGQNILLALKTISNGELSDPLCNSKNRGLTLVRLQIRGLACKDEDMHGSCRIYVYRFIACYT